MWQHASAVLCKDGAFDEGSVEEPQTPCHLLFYLFAKTMLYSIDKVTTEYQHPWIARNCRVYKYLLCRSVYRPQWWTESTIQQEV